MSEAHKQSTKTPFNVFSVNCASKFSTLVKRLTPSNIEISIDIVLSKNLETIFYNPEFLKTFEEKRIKISFLETISVENYDMDVVSDILVISSCEDSEINKFIDFLNRFIAVHRLTFTLHLLVYPRRTYLTKKIIEASSSLELKKVLKSIHDINFDFFALDDDFLNLEYPLTTVEMFRTKELNYINLSAEAIFKFQLLFGSFTEVASKGQSANIMLKILSSIQKENTNVQMPTNRAYPSLFVIDRTEDLVTPFLSQFTYTGLLDQVFGISKNIIRIAKKIVDPNANEGEQTFYNLMTENAKIYSELKNLSYPEATWFIRNKILELSVGQNEPLNYQDFNATMKKVEDAKQSQLIRVHFKFMQASDEYLKSVLTVISRSMEREVVEGETRDHFEQIIDLIQSHFPFEKLLRLIALVNISNGGFTARQIEQICKEIMESYGSAAYDDLLEFETAGFITNKEDSDSNTSLIKKTDLENKKKVFSLLNPAPHNDSATAIDFSASYDGYYSLLVRIFESLLTSGKDKVPIEYWKGGKNDFFDSEGIVLFVIGGLTYSEVVSIRKLKKSLNKKILICTTNILDSESIVRSFITLD